MHRLQHRICALNGFNYAPFWMNESIKNTVNSTIVPKHTTADVADQLVDEPTTGGAQREQQIEFLEVAPTDYDFKPQPSSVDINYAESVRSFLTRPYPVFQGTWTGDDLFNTELLNIDPLQVYLNIPVVSGKLQGFNYLRAGIKFELRLNGTRFHYGLLCGAFFPLSLMKTYDSSQTHVEAMTMFPSTIVDPSSSEIGTFTVPYVYPRHFLRLTDADDRLTLGTFSLKVLDSLAVVNATTVPSITYTLYVSLVDPVVNAFTAFPALTGVTTFLEEQLGDSAQRFVPENMNFLATDINDVAVRTGMQGDNRVDNDEQYIGASRDDMLFKTIYTKPNLISVFGWSSTATPGTSINFIPVSPLIRGNNSSHYLYHLARANKFWRGTLRYHIRIVASGFHSGRLLISWDPVAADEDDFTNVDHSNRMSMVVDIQQSTDVYFSIPHMAPQPWLPSAIPGTISSTNGALFFSVLNSLATPSGEPTTVGIIAWMYGSDDFQVAMPYTQIPTTLGPFAAPPALEEQCCDEPLSDSKFSNLINSHSVPSKMLMGENLTSVSHLLQKMALIVSGTAMATTAVASMFVPSTLTSVAGPIGPDPLSNYGWLSRMFVINRGSYRYAWLGYTIAARGTTIEEYFVGPTTTTDPFTGFPGYGALVVRSSTPNAIHEVPWYSTALFNVTTPSDLVPQLGPTEVSFPGSKFFTRTAAVADCYAGLGEDFMLAYLVPPPRV